MPGPHLILPSNKRLPRKPKNGKKFTRDELIQLVGETPKSHKLMCDDRVIYNATPNYESDPLNDIALAVSHHNFYGNVLICEPEYLEPEFL